MGATRSRRLIRAASTKKTHMATIDTPPMSTTGTALSVMAWSVCCGS